MNLLFRSLRVPTFAALWLAALPLAAADPTGTWVFSTETPNGRSIESTLTVRRENGKLVGRIDNRAGSTAVRDLQFADDTLSFTVERRIRWRKVNLRYSGRVEGEILNGTIETTTRKGQSIQLPWTAKRQPIAD